MGEDVQNISNVLRPSLCKPNKVCIFIGVWLDQDGPRPSKMVIKVICYYLHLFISDLSCHTKYWWHYQLLLAAIRTNY